MKDEDWWYEDEDDWISQEEADGNRFEKKPGHGNSSQETDDN